MKKPDAEFRPASTRMPKASSRQTSPNGTSVAPAEYVGLDPGPKRGPLQERLKEDHIGFRRRNLAKGRDADGNCGDDEEESAH